MFTATGDLHKIVGRSEHEPIEFSVLLFERLLKVGLVSFILSYF